MDTVAMVRMGSYFKRDKAAAKIQEADWRKLVKLAKRESEFISRPCTYCGVQMTMATPDTLNVLTNETQDHITPRSKGGSITVPCCFGCNRDKHHLSVNEWRLVLMYRRKRIVLYFYERILLKNLLVKGGYLLSRLVSC